ncbi:MAG TPA: hypothetical protein VF215_03755 [Thermoanaerobaculia bacterium]
MKPIASRILVTLVFLVTASVAGAAEYSDLYIIPAAAHAHGAFGTEWRSDVVLHNIQAVPITVELALVESGRGPAVEPIVVSAGAETTFALMPDETRLLSDVAAFLGRDATGALIVGANLPFAVTSRTWAELPGRRTLGQSVVPVAIAGSADAINDIAVLPSLTVSAGQRSNVGMFVAASHAPLVIEVAALSASGATLGTQLIVVDEPGFVHRQLSIAPTAEGTSITATIRILQGDGIVVPYASTIDNVSAEAMFVSAEPIAVGGAASRSMLKSCCW